MTKPVWETPAGDLGTIQEGKFYQLTLMAFDETSGSSDSLFYTMLAGVLPGGMRVGENGIITGIPKAIAGLTGVPLEVGKNITSKFAIRAYSKRIANGVLVVDQVADRTFTITVAGQDIPVWVTAAGSLGSQLDGDQIEIQLEYTDPDPDQTIVVNLINGSLPQGLTLSSTGLLSGILEPIALLSIDAVAGFDRIKSAFDQFPFDNSTRSSSKNYEFTLEITDGYDSNLRTFGMFVRSKDDLTMDSDQISCDQTYLTADDAAVRTPMLLTKSGSIGVIRHSNFFAYKFDAVDYDGDIIEYSVSTGAADVGFDLSGTTFDQTGVGFDKGIYSLPPGLAINSTTGWFYGYIPDVGVTETVYNFAISVKKQDYPTYSSPIRLFNITIIGSIDQEITWLSSAALGTLTNGQISNLYVAATMQSGTRVQYRLKTGSNSRLPNGLTLLPSGNIAGQVSFQSFTLDNGTTTFQLPPASLPTTFDSTFAFTVEAYNLSAIISTFKDFTIKIDVKYPVPYETLYITATPKDNDKNLINQLLNNRDIFDPAIIYRADDANFGLAKSVVYQHAFGIKASSMDEYVTALELNHYRKNLILGKIKVARSLDIDDNIEYEVVYSEIKEDFDIGDAQPPLEVELAYPYIPEDDSVEVSTVYPNNLLSMQTRIRNTTGDYGEILPGWMKTKQDDGSILGFTPAWVIAFVNPGEGSKLAYNINEKFGQDINAIDFDIDRYIVDKSNTRFWDAENNEWLVGNQVTFDRYTRSSFLNFVGNDSTDSTIDGRVNFATILAFSEINQQTVAHVASLGGINGITTQGGLQGKSMVFLNQEEFDDIDAAWSYPDSVLVPGVDESRADSSSIIDNQRMAIWEMQIDPVTEIITLYLKRQTYSNDYIYITEATGIRGNYLYYPTSSAPGLRYVNWQYIDFASTRIGDETLFDGGSTTLISNKDSIKNDDRYAKYVLYPKHNITGNKDYITND